MPDHHLLDSQRARRETCTLLGHFYELMNRVILHKGFPVCMVTGYQKVKIAGSSRESGRRKESPWRWRRVLPEVGKRRSVNVYRQRKSKNLSIKMELGCLVYNDHTKKKP